MPNEAQTRILINRLLQEAGWDNENPTRVWGQAASADGEVCLDFAHCDFLRANAVAFLGGLIRLLQYRGMKVWIHNVGPSIRPNLLNNGFLPSFAGEKHPGNGNTVPFREDWVRDAADYERYLSRQWLGQGWADVSQQFAESSLRRPRRASWLFDEMRDGLF